MIRSPASFCSGSRYGNSFGAPLDWDLPAKFVNWRPVQTDALHDTLDAFERGVRFVGSTLPTGVGKSSYAVALHKMLPSSRTVILTATKALQLQYIADFESTGMRALMGRNAYSCRVYKNCEWGQAGKCPARRSDSCPAFAAENAFLRGEIVVTNYHAWISRRQGERGVAAVGDFDLLVLDEADSAVGVVGDICAINIDADEGLQGLPDNAGEWVRDQWRKWARDAAGKVALPDPESSPERFVREKARKQKYERLAALPDDWILDETNTGWQFNPLWPGTGASEVLYGDIPRVVLMSGTLTKMTMEVLGAGGVGGAAAHFDYPSPFDPARSPVYRPSWAPRLTKRSRTTEEDLGAMLTLLDQFIGRRLDRKGLIQTGSYARRDLILRNSRHRGYMVTHEYANTASVVERFKAMGRVGYLVSPSVHTGFDFPGPTCRANVLVKVPYEDNRERKNLAKARSEANPGWTTAQAIQKASQAIGRGMRSGDDWQECLVTDGSWGGVLWRNKEMSTQWVKDLDRKIEGTLPEPMKW